MTQKPVASEDLRVRRTRKLLQEAFIELTVEKGFAALQAVTEPEPGAPPTDLRLSCIAYAGVGAMVWWLEQEQPCSSEQLATWLCELGNALAGPSLKSKP